MAKRFTDTDKWKKNWFSDLSPVHKLIWIYILDECDASGVWCANFKRLSFDTGAKINREQFEEAFEGKVLQFGEDKYFIAAFIEFQYGELREESRPHAAVIKQLKKHGLYEGYQNSSIEYPKGIHTLKDKEQDKEKEQEGESEGEKSEGIKPDHLFALWNMQRGSLPECLELSEARKKAARVQLKKFPTLHHWENALRKFTESSFCLNEWRPGFDDWLEEPKRLRALENRYADREGRPTGKPAQPSPIKHAAAESVIAEQSRRREAEGGFHEDVAKAGIEAIKEKFRLTKNVPHEGAS